MGQGKIFKWEIPFPQTEEFELEMYDYTEHLTVQIQNGVPCFWALVDVDSKREMRKYRVIGTGHNFDLENEIWIGTWQDGPFVWHLVGVYLPEEE